MSERDQPRELSSQQNVKINPKHQVQRKDRKMMTAGSTYAGTLICAWTDDAVAESGQCEP